MSYTPRYERFEAVGPSGQRYTAEFVRAGFLAQGDQPELYFFRVSGEESVVGISGASLARYQRGRRYLTREEKIDLAGRWLKQQIEAGVALESRNLYLQNGELAGLAGDLGFAK